MEEKYISRSSGTTYRQLYSGSAPEGAHSIDFAPELPRLPIGTLYGRLLRDRSWGDKTSRIV